MIKILLFTISCLVAVASEVLRDDRAEMRKITFYLKQDLKSLREIVSDVSNPRSKNFGKHLTRKEISSITSPTLDDIQVMTSWLEKNVIEYEMDLKHAKFDVWMALEAAEDVFDTTFHQHQDHFRLQAGNYHIPDDISNVTQAVFHLRGLPLPATTPLFSSGNPANVTPAVLASTYGISGVEVEGNKKNRAAVAEF